MESFRVVIVLLGISGIAMVAGGLFLLWRAPSTLALAPATDALQLEIPRLIRINTRYPALGLIALGLAALLSAGQLSQAEADAKGLADERAEAQAFDLQGKILAPDPSSVTVALDSEHYRAQPVTDGTFKGTIHPKSNYFLLRVSAPGFMRPEASLMIDRPTAPGAVALDPIDLVSLLGEVTVRKPSKNPVDIQPAPADLAPIEAAGSYGNGGSSR